MGACRLSRRSGTAKLTTSTTAGGPGTEGEVLTAQSLGTGDGDWRIIDLWSDELSPWEARVVWSGGGGAQRTAKVDVPKCIRVCVHATTIQVFGSNLSTSADIPARAAIADGQCETENQWTERGAVTPQDIGGAGGNVDVKPPPWARFAERPRTMSTMSCPSATVGVLRSPSPSPSPTAKAGTSRFSKMGSPAAFSSSPSSR